MACLLWVVMEYLTNDKVEIGEKVHSAREDSIQ